MRSREVHTDPCPENQATLLAYHDPRAVQVSSLILVHDPWCPSTIPTVDGLSDQQSTCAKVLIESSPWMRGVVHRSRWASHVLGRATHALIRGGCRISFRFRGPFSGLVRVIACASFRNCARNLLSSILSRLARDASSTQSCGTAFSASTRHPYFFQAEGWCLVVTGDRMVGTHMSHRTSSQCSRDGASMDGFHCSSSCTGGMTWSGSDVSGELSRVAQHLPTTCDRTSASPLMQRLSPAPRARLDRAWFT